MAFTPHDGHDPLLIAAHAAGDTTGEESRQAADLVATCETCATLHADLVAIAAATRVLPAPVRTHDYRLTPEQAAKLRPTAQRRLLAALGSTRFAFAAPLGATLATLGLAGLLLAAIPGISLQGATSSSASVNVAAAAPSVVTNGAGAAGQAAPSAAVSGPAAAAAQPEASASAAPSASAARSAVGAAQPSPALSEAAGRSVPPTHVDQTSQFGGPAASASSGTVDTLGGVSGASPVRVETAEPLAVADKATAAPAFSAAPTPASTSPSIPTLPIASVVLVAIGAGLVVARVAGRRFVRG